MINEIIKYAEGQNASEEVLEWIEKRVEKKHDQSDVEHIIDFLVSDKAPKNLERATYDQMKERSGQWTESLIKKGENINEGPEDVEVIKKWKDGFKFVKLIGENAYKREGFLMRHCVKSFFGKDDEIYSLRDDKNMPHATLSKQSQQIKGKGNGNIHPKYIKYVVEFLEHLEVEVRDSEMQNLGYVNVENFEDKNAVFKDLFRDKYFYIENDVLDKDGNKYENITLWGIKNIFDFTKSLKVNINFNFRLCAKTFCKYLKKNKKQNRNQLVMKDYNHVAMESYNQLAMKDYNHVAMEDCNQLAMESYNQLAMKYYNHVAMENRNQLVMYSCNNVAMENRNQLAMYSCNHVAMENHNQLAMKDYNQLAMENYSHVAMENRNQLAMNSCNNVAMEDFSQLAMKSYNHVAMEDHNQLAMKSYNHVAMESCNHVAMDDHNQLAMKDYNHVAMRNCNHVAMEDHCKAVGSKENTIKIGKNSIALMGKDSKIKGKVGGWMIFSEYKEGEIINIHYAKIDGKKYKENTWYHLQGSKIVEYK